VGQEERGRSITLYVRRRTAVMKTMVRNQKLLGEQRKEGQRSRCWMKN
jgi:hypothetical protein